MQVHCSLEVQAPGPPTAPAPAHAGQALCNHAGIRIERGATLASARRTRAAPTTGYPGWPRWPRRPGALHACSRSRLLQRTSGRCTRTRAAPAAGHTCRSRWPQRPGAMHTCGRSRLLQHTSGRCTEKASSTRRRASRPAALATKACPGKVRGRSCTRTHISTDLVHTHSHHLVPQQRSAAHHTCPVSARLRQPHRRAPQELLFGSSPAHRLCQHIVLGHSSMRHSRHVHGECCGMTSQQCCGPCIACLPSSVGRVGALRVILQLLPFPWLHEVRSAAAGTLGALWPRAHKPPGAPAQSGGPPQSPPPPCGSSPGSSPRPACCGAQTRPTRPSTQRGGAPLGRPACPALRLLAARRICGRHPAAAHHLRPASAAAPDRALHAHKQAGLNWDALRSAPGLGSPPACRLPAETAVGKHSGCSGQGPGGILRASAACLGPSQMRTPRQQAGIHGLPPILCCGMQHATPKQPACAAAQVPSTHQPHLCSPDHCMMLFWQPQMSSVQALHACALQHSVGCAMAPDLSHSAACTVPRAVATKHTLTSNAEHGWASLAPAP